MSDFILCNWKVVTCDAEYTQNYYPMPIPSAPQRITGSQHVLVHSHCCHQQKGHCFQFTALNSDRQNKHPAGEHMELLTNTHPDASH